MKTITECQPLIYGMLIAQAERRKVRQRKNVQRLRMTMPALYAFVGLAIVFDAGIMPWDISFWLIFSPVFIFGEWVLSTVTRSEDRRRGTERRLAQASEGNSTNTKAVETPKRKAGKARNRSRRESSALVLNAFRVRRRVLAEEASTPAHQLTARGGRSGSIAAFQRDTAVLASSR